MREQDAPVGDRDHIIVKRPRGDRFLALRGEEGARRIEPMKPRHRLRRFDMLAGREWASGHAIDEHFDPRRAMPARQPHVVGRALVAISGGHRGMDRERLAVGEGEPQLRQRRRPFVAAMRHRFQIRDGEVAAAVAGIGRWADRRRIGRPHRRRAHRVGDQMRLGGLGRRPKRGQPLARRARLGHEQSLRQPERQIGAHLVEPLQRRRARLRHRSGIFRRGEIAEAQPGIIVAWPDDPVEIDLADCHRAIASTRSPTSTLSNPNTSGSTRNSPRSSRRARAMHAVKS